MHRPTARVVTALTAVLVCTGGVPVAAASASPFDGYKDQQLSWGPCLFTPTEGALPAECALVTVPRDWANPGAGVDLRVSVSRVKATGERAGVLLLNPGGPGVQATSMAGDLAALQPAVVEKYDFIGMDPRGTGQEGGTQPEHLGLVCSVPNDRLSKRTDLDARDRSADSIAEHHKAPRAIAEACQSEALTPYITTWQTAHDMELIRQLLGESTLNYLGYSYGTWLGAKYTSLFPASAGKVVLDSSVNWQGRLQAAFEDFPMIGQRQFDEVFLPWMARTFPAVVGGTAAEAKKTWEDVRAYFKTQGLAGDSYDRLFVGMGSSLRWVLGALVFVLGASAMQGEEPPAVQSAELQAMLDAKAKAEFGVPVAQLTAAKIVATVADNDYTKVPGTRYAVACGDQPTRSATWYKALSNRQGPQYPLFGWAYGLSEPCAFWSDAPQQTLPNLPAAAAGKVLVVQGEFDPQTGYEQARSAIRAAPGVSFVSIDDSAFHGQYAAEGNPCVDGMVNVFLLRNSRPGNATCPGVPLPGETQVYPVAGPVKQTSAQATLAVQQRSALRAAVQDRIGVAPVM